MKCKLCESNGRENELVELPGQLKNKKSDDGRVLVCPRCDSPDREVSSGKNIIQIAKENAE